MSRSKKKTPRWRREQNKRVSDKKKSSIYLGLFFIFLISFLVLFSFLWQKALPSIWDGRSRIGIVSMKENELDITVFLPKQEKTVSFKAPLNTMGETPFGFGEYQLGSVYALGKLENEGGKLLMRTVQDNFSIFVSGFRVEGGSNLTWWDSLRVWWYEVLVASKKEVVDLSKEQVFEASTLADGTKVFRIKTLLLDEVINQELFDEEMLQEELEVAVLNASGESGVASKVSRLIRNLGGDVTVVSSLEPVEVSKIQVTKESDLKSYTVEFLSSILSIEQVELVADSKFRADVVVVIGKDDLSLK